LLGLLASVASFPELRAMPTLRWRLAAPPLLVGAASVLLLYLPPANDLAESGVWLIALPAAVVGLVRGMMVNIQVDHGTGKLLLEGAPEGFWIVACAVSGILFAVVGKRLDAQGWAYGPAVELLLVIASAYLIALNLVLAVRSYDAPQQDLSC